MPRSELLVRVPVSDATLLALRALEQDDGLSRKAARKRLEKFMEGAVTALALGSLPALELRHRKTRRQLPKNDEVYTRRLRAAGLDDTRISGFLAAQRHYRTATE